MEMVSEREIEAAIKAIEAVPIMDDTYSLSGEDAKAAARAALEAAARVRAEADAETLIDTVSEEVWNHDASQDNCNVIDKDGLTNTGEPVAWRDETDAEHIARDMREGRFPARSERQQVPVTHPASQPSESVCEECQQELALDVHVPDPLWAKISPRPVEGYKGGGLLCPQCIVTRLCALTAEPEPSGTVKPLDEDDYEEIISAAAVNMRKATSGIRGQVVTVQDSLDWWVMKETERRILSALTAGKPEQHPDDEAVDCFA